MENRDIETLKKILALKNRQDLVELITGCKGLVETSGSYGDRLNSEISSFEICAPVEKYYQLKTLSETDRNLILEGILDIHPPKDHSPDIKSVGFQILQDQEEDKTIAKPAYIGRTIRAFISYSTLDKVLAGQVKEELEMYGLEVFLAHDDIEPAADWQQVILDNLQSTDIFLPLLTENFSESKWTDQESGIAYTHNKLIVPLSVNGNHPYGFIGKFQSLKLDSRPGIISGTSIIKAVIHVKSEIEKQIVDSLIKSFASSRSFEEAKKKSRLLLEFENMTEDQINEIFTASITNHEIFESFGAQSSIRYLFNKDRKKIKSELAIQVKLLYKITDPEGVSETEF